MGLFRKDAPALPAPARVSAPAPRMDGWTNILTGLGDFNRDKRFGASVNYCARTYLENYFLWRADDMAARIIERPVEEMTREWFDVKIPGDKDLAEELANEHEEMGLREKTVEAAEYMRAYGGGAIWVGANDGRRPDQPLNEDAIRSIDFLTALKPTECQGITFYDDPTDPSFGLPELYLVVPELSGSVTTVHASRILRFQGNIVSARQLREFYGWGDSVFVRVFDALRDFHAAFGGSSALVQDFSQAVYSISGLREMLASDDGANRIKTRLQIMDMTRSLIRAVILDAGDASGKNKEDFERKSTPVTGLPDLLDRHVQRLAAAADMPVELLVGETTKGGLGNAGDSKIVWWEKHVANLQKKKLAAPLRRFVRLHLFSKGPEPERWRLVFRSLSQLSDLDESTRRFQIAQADQIYISNGVVSAQEIADSRFGEEYSADTVLDLELRAKMQDALDRAAADDIGKPDPVEAAKEQAAAAKAAGQTGPTTAPAEPKP